MCGKDLGADRVFAWPTAEVAVMGAEGAAEIVFRKEIQEADGQSRQARGADRALSRGVLESLRGGGAPAGGCGDRAGADAAALAQALEYLHTKRELRPAKKHGLMPL